MARRNFYDPEGKHFGLPTFPYHQAPRGLLTRRQLRARNLSPGGQDPKAQILWQHYKQLRVAYLYDERMTVPKRVPTPAQLAAIQKALIARKTCQSCGEVKDYCIPTSFGECPDCAEGTRGSPEKEEEMEAAA